MQTNKAIEKIKIIYDALLEKKGINIKIIDISAVSPVSDFFIIVSGSNINQVHALSDNVYDELSKHGYKSNKLIEGYKSGNWILMDYEDVVIHVFDNESRAFYNLERLWSDGIEVDFQS